MRSPTRDMGVDGVNVSVVGDGAGAKPVSKTFSTECRLPVQWAPEGAIGDNKPTGSRLPCPRASDDRTAMAVCSLAAPHHVCLSHHEIAQEAIPGRATLESKSGIWAVTLGCTGSGCPEEFSCRSARNPSRSTRESESITRSRSIRRTPRMCLTYWVERVGCALRVI